MTAPVHTLGSAPAPLPRGPYGALRQQTARNLRVQESFAALFPGDEARPRLDGEQIAQ
jgi:hypothetical protein